MMDFFLFFCFCFNVEGKGWKFWRRWISSQTSPIFRPYCQSSKQHHNNRLGAERENETKKDLFSFFLFLFFVLLLFRSFVASLFRSLSSPRTNLFANLRKPLEDALLSSSTGNLILRFCDRAMQHLGYDAEISVLPFLREICTVPQLQHTESLPTELRVRDSEKRSLSCIYPFFSLFSLATFRHHHPCCTQKPYQ